MSVYSFESDSDEKSVEKPHEFDELVAEHEALNVSQPPTEPDTLDTEYRYINFILDHSAFVRGIGNIKRWFNEEYIRASYKHNSGDKIKLVIHIPTYTLHEFDFVKKGNTMIATNAREAIKFIDKFVNDEEENTTRVIDSMEFNCSLDIEVPNARSGPSWNECLNYKIYRPLVREFPNFKTKFDSNLLGQNSAHQLNNNRTTNNQNQLNDIQYENSESYQNALAHSDSPAEMPDRLKYLIKSCISKLKSNRSNYKTNDHWRLVTEDPITKIWAISFGIECMNINEAELFIFQDYDINAQKKSIDPHFQYNDDNEKGPKGPNSILQNTIDTTVYEYTTTNEEDNNNTKNVKSKKNGSKEKSKEAEKKDANKKDTGKKKKNSQKGKVRDQVSQGESAEGLVHEGTGVYGGIVKKERFNAINYAPRGSGELWKP
ncbi:nonsense-mediated decay protein 4 [[Candida] railenensis]|uniref:Nonsense-mediated decay protein 4 n=1 Tax=[Candida] railenensis TaxID=45579 RepID=A0A9P0QP44_9ASCO|nr:nonsense-mediated decay protein 4 [[Candida] railenensis]